MTDEPDEPLLPNFGPVPIKYYCHDGWTLELQHAFVEALARCARPVGLICLWPNRD